MVDKKRKKIIRRKRYKVGSIFFVIAFALFFLTTRNMQMALGLSWPFWGVGFFLSFIIINKKKVIEQNALN